MRRVVRFCGALVLGALMIGGCSWFASRREKPAAVPASLSATAPTADQNREKALSEAEVKAAPVAEPPAAAPPAVTPAPVAPSDVSAGAASPAEQTKETLGPKPAQTAALTPPRSTLPPAAEPSPAKTFGSGTSRTGSEPQPTAQAPSGENDAQPTPPVTGETAAQQTSGQAQPAKAANREVAALEPPAPVAEPAAPAPSAAKAAAPAAPGGASGKVAVVGDSLAVGVGITMEQNLKKYEGMTCFPLGKVSTGLISKHFFDWEKRLNELVAKEKIASVVVVMGGNDANNSIAGHAPGTSEWSAAYAQKAEAFMRIAAKAGAKVLWVGLPAMRDPAYATRVLAVNAAARQACAAVPGCTYMEAGDTFVDGAGHYVQAKTIDGKKVTLRAKDGVHMTMTGYNLLCRQVLDRMGKSGELPAQGR